MNQETEALHSNNNIRNMILGDFELFVKYNMVIVVATYDMAHLGDDCLPVTVTSDYLPRDPAPPDDLRCLPPPPDDSPPVPASHVALSPHDGPADLRRVSAPPDDLSPVPSRPDDLRRVPSLSHVALLSHGMLHVSLSHCGPPGAAPPDDFRSLDAAPPDDFRSDMSIDRPL